MCAAASSVDIAESTWTVGAILRGFGTACSIIYYEYNIIYNVSYVPKCRKGSQKSDWGGQA
jgi:hypothetical protein